MRSTRLEISLRDYLPYVSAMDGKYSGKLLAHYKYFPFFGFYIYYSYRNYKWFWIPPLCSLLGGIAGAWSYQLLIGIHIPSEIDELEEEVRKIQFDKAQTHNLQQ